MTATNLIKKDIVTCNPSQRAENVCVNVLVYTCIASIVETFIKVVENCFPFADKSP